MILENERTTLEVYVKEPVKVDMGEPVKRTREREEPRKRENDPKGPPPTPEKKDDHTRAR